MRVNQSLNFDTSLGLFAEALTAVLGISFIVDGWIIRNAQGQLALVSSKNIPAEQCQKANEAAVTAVGPYCFQNAIVFLSSPGVKRLIEGAHSYQVEQNLLGQDALLKIVDQRIVGADWLIAPAMKNADSIPRFTFASMKGGVGRTTALAVAATDLAAAGRKVLVIDLDLEAPGIGAMMLSANELPKYGLLDGYVESALSNIDDDLFFDMLAPSPFGRGRGLIDVVPAVGRNSNAHPANVLAKLARAYVESALPSGEIINFSAQTRKIIDRFASFKQYDFILIDARAGLNESTAAALLGLGAQVLLFGEDTPQTFSDYRYLLSHLSRFPRDEKNDWLYRFKMVHAKASADAKRQQAFRDKAFDIFREFLYRENDLSENPSDPDGSSVGMLEFSLDDDLAPHGAIPILRDSRYFEFDPLSDPDQLVDSVYEAIYRPLLSYLKQSEIVSNPII